jgi:hypothetical protein
MQTLRLLRFGATVGLSTVAWGWPLSAAQSEAQHWPQRPVKLIVPLGPGLNATAQVINPGGPSEFAASIDAQRPNRENRPGARHQAEIVNVSIRGGPRRGGHGFSQCTGGIAASIS